MWTASKVYAIDKEFRVAAGEHMSCKGRRLVSPVLHRKQLIASLSLLSPHLLATENIPSQVIWQTIMGRHLREGTRGPWTCRAPSRTRSLCPLSHEMPGDEDRAGASGASLAKWTGPQARHMADSGATLMEKKKELKHLNLLF